MDTRLDLPTEHRPRVRVTLDARIRWWNRRADGTWWALIEYQGWAGDQPFEYVIAVPAAAVEQIAGEDYSTVRRRRTT